MPTCGNRLNVPVPLLLVGFIRYGPHCVRNGRTGRCPVVVLSLVGLMSLLGTACQRSDGDERATTTTTSSSTTTTTLDAEKAAVLVAYRSFRTAYQEAGDPPNPLHADLPKYADGTALETATETILAWKSAGWVVRGTVDLAPRVERIEGDRALVRDCLFDGLGIYEAAHPEKLVEPMDTARVLDRVTLTRVGGAWKVAEVERRRGETCTPEP